MKVGVETDLGHDYKDDFDSRIDDVRFLVIRPKGYIAKHVDIPDQNWLEPLNISITYPKGNKFILNNKELKYEPGMSVVLNIHYEHYVENNSDEDDFIDSSGDNWKTDEYGDRSFMWEYM